MGLAGESHLNAGGSTYKERLDQTPTNGEWSGPRVESTFTSAHPAVKGKKVRYSNGYGDLSPHTKHTVEIDDFVAKVKSAKDPRKKLHREADKILAKRLGVSPKIIAKFRQTNRFTWHEVEDMNTLQLVPTDINGKFGHLGGISETLKI